MKPGPVPVPASVRETSGAIHIECYELHGCGIVVQRIDVADQRAASRDYRWKIEIGHTERHPDLSEIIAARELVPEEIHMAMPFPRAGFQREQGFSFHLWEIKDPDLTDMWEFDVVNERRQSGDLRGE